MTFSALLDTCVLVPSVLRDLLLELGPGPAYRPLWSNCIEDELSETIVTLRTRRGRDREETRAYVTRLLSQMNTALPDARVEVQPNEEEAFNKLPDPGDAHVIAAAVAGRADVIVTFNLKDFPNEILPRALFSQSPDYFLLDLLGLHPRQIESALEAIIGRTGRRGPAWSRSDLLARLKRERLPKFVAAASEMLT